MLEAAPLASVGRVILTDFMVARCLETLESEGCRYHRGADGAVICECERASGPVLQTVRELNLIQRGASIPGLRDPLLRVLADAYATHPDYQTEWHSLLSSSPG